MEPYMWKDFLKAVLIGMGSFLALSIGILASTAVCLLGASLLSPSFLDRLSGLLVSVSRDGEVYIMYAHIVGVLISCSAGFVAASYVRTRKLPAAGCIGILNLLFFAVLCFFFLRLFLPEPVVLSVFSEMPWYGVTPITVAWFLLPPLLGALVQGRFRNRFAKEKIRTIGQLLFAHMGLFIGLFLFSLSALVLLLCPVPFSFGDYYWLLLSLIIGAIVTGYGFVTLSRTVSFFTGVVKNPAFYCIVFFALLCNIMFIYRDFTNRPDPEYMKREITKLNSRFGLPPEENSALLYRKAFESISVGEEEKALASALQADKECNDPFFAPEVNIDDDGDAWINCVGSSFRERNLLHSALFEKAEEHAAKGMIIDSLPFLDCSFHLATAYRWNGFIGFADGLKLREKVCCCIRNILQKPTLSTGQIAAVQKQLDQWAGGEFFKKAFHYNAGLENLELSETIDVHDLPIDRQYGASSVYPFFLRHLFSKRFFRETVQSGWNKVFEKESFRDMLTYLRERSKEHGFFHLTNISAAAETDGLFTSTLNAFIVHNDAMVSRLLDDQARLTILRAYAAVCLFRKKNQRLPDDWAELVTKNYLPEVPEDPFTGQDLGWLSKENRLTLYSVGKDGMDNKGKGVFSTNDPCEEEQESFKKNKTDISLSILHP